MNGVLNIDKPAGMTSHDVVARIRRLTKIKRVGHAGTLDPDATGVLLVCIGAATRLAEYLAEQGKTYRCTLSLGVTTDTEDGSGTVLEERDAGHITETDLRAVLPQFIGEIMQVPPMVSALHHDGKRLYELARAGITVERAARPIRIDSIQLMGFEGGPHPHAILDVGCGKGTYVRTLCADIGNALGVGGHMARLVRTSVGVFDICQAHSLDLLTQEKISSALITPSQAVGHLPRMTIQDDIQFQDILHGRPVPTELEDGTIAAVVDKSDNLIAIGRAEDLLMRPFKVFVQEQE